jgi:predicted AlkP superfamily pyrophosphatase or phosphodiesterase
MHSILVTPFARSFTIGVFCLLGLPSYGTQTGDKPPKLVVVLVVDQMRADYLNRFGGYFTGGLARLLDSGAVFTDAHQDHATTVTAVGHATIATGVFPSSHGIVDNDFFDRTENREVYSASDSSAPLLGVPTAPGRSPQRLMRDALGDWLKRASPESKVFSVAIKDRSAIMMAGHQADGAYWYHAPRKGLVTSTYYQQAYPAWVDSFNNLGLIESYFQLGWSKLMPEEVYLASREDSFPAERGIQQFTFPYVFAELFADSTGLPSPDYYDGILYSPFGDAFVFEFAKAIVVNEQLGEDDTPDILFIGASSADYIGHRWGPLSHEVQDYYLRLDQYLDSLFSFLDSRIGRGNYVFALSADHGASHTPEELARRGFDARRIAVSERREVLIRAVEGATRGFGIDITPNITYMDGLFVSFPDSVTVPLTDVHEAIADSLRTLDIVADAYTFGELSWDATQHRPYFDAFQRSFYPTRVADVLIRFKEHYVTGSSTANHGSTYRYDTHVPIILAGRNVAPGRYNDRVRTVDIAPTLALLLGLETPSDLDGRALTSALAITDQTPDEGNR